jgi:prenyltransferase beta subunit
VNAGDSKTVDAGQALKRGLAWLTAQQADGGGWHSTTYGQLKDGAAVTTLALYALAHLPADVQEQQTVAIERGFAFLDRGLAKRGTIAAPDGSLDFPTYAAAQWLISRRRLALETPDEQRQKVVDYLLGAQVAESRGFEPSSPSYGGWDFLGREDAQGVTTGTNVSVACYVLEALASATPDPRRAAVEAALKRGKAWVLRCQQEDGGFAFTSEPQSLNNKAAYRDEQLTQPRAYGTATCDGLRALLACGLKATDEPVASAVAWLGKRPAIEVVPGFERLPPEAGWDRGLRHYYWASLSAVLPLRAPGEVAARSAVLANLVATQQHDDGSWRNDSDRMRENDPLIATPLAIVALANCMSQPAANP